MRYTFLCLLVFVNFQIYGQEIVRLDNAIQFLGKQVENDIRQGSRIAIVSFDSPSEGFSNYVIGELNNVFVRSNKFTVVEQQKIDLVRQEEQRQLSLNVSDETAVRIGHNIGAQYIISGFLIDLGTTYRFGIYAINMQDAVRVAQASVYLSAYDEQVVFLITGNIRRPSEKIIPVNLTMASSKAGFMQSISTMIGNLLINRIPRNSKIAIIIPGDYVLADYVRNELYFVLNSSNRFRMIDLGDVDLAFIRKYGPPVIYDPPPENERLEFIPEIHRTLVASGSNEDLQEIGRSLGANVIISTQYMDSQYTTLDSPEVSEFLIQIIALSVNSLEEISSSRAYWMWVNGEEQSFFE